MSIGSDISRSRAPSIRTVWVAGGVAVCAAVVLVYFLIDPTRVAIFPPCLFHQLTGLDCPGCGGQRALHQLLHGNLLAAIRLNAMLVVSLPVLAWVGARYLICHLKSQPMNFRFQWLWFYFAAWMLFGLLRNLPVPIFHWFAA